MAKIDRLHNRLVRDKIPEYLQSRGVAYEIESVTDRVRLLRLLLDQLEEEAQKVALVTESEILEKLGDVETVVDGVLKMIGQTRLNLEKQQAKKDLEQGGLNNGVFLIKTIEEEEKDGTD